MLRREQCLDQLRRLLADGRWQVGERLPAEADLAARLVVARGTLRWALERLVHEGALLRRPGAGRKSCGLEVHGSGEPPAIGHEVLLLSHACGHWAGPDARPMGREEYALDAAAGAALDQAALPWRAIEADAIDRRDGGRSLLRRASAVVATTAGLYHGGYDAAVRLLRLARSLGLPAVVGECLDPQLSACDQVGPDHAAGVDLATTWLLERGFRRIVPVTGSPLERQYLTQRHAGYAAAMRRAGLMPRPWLRLHPNAEIGLAHDAFDRLVRGWVGFLLPVLTGPDGAQALVCGNDYEAVLVAGALRAMGLEPGRTVALAGFDGNWRDGDATWEPCPPTVTVDQDWPGQGTALVGMLLERRRLGPAAPARRHLVPPRLLVNVPRARPRTGAIAGPAVLSVRRKRPA